MAKSKRKTKTPSKAEIKFGQEFYRNERSFETNPLKREAEQRSSAYKRKLQRDYNAQAGIIQDGVSLKVQAAHNAVSKFKKPKKK